MKHTHHRGGSIVPTVGLLAIMLVLLGTVPMSAAPLRSSETVTLEPGAELLVDCPTYLDGSVEGSRATLRCKEAEATPEVIDNAVIELQGVSAGQTLAGTATIEALPADPNVERVVFMLTGPESVEHTEKHAPFFFLGDADGTPLGWDTTQVADGDYTLTVTVHDDGAEVATTAVSFAVDNANVDVDMPTTEPTTVPTEPTTPPADDDHDQGDHDYGDHASGAVGVCGEPMDTWHPPMVDGCATGHEHGDPPPEWIMDAGYEVKFHSHANTSPAENTAKHAAMKGFATTLDNVDIYFRVHASSNVLDRSARYHSYEVWARDPSGNVSRWQGWYDTGDPVMDRIPRGEDPGRRPVMLVVDQNAWDRGIRCEQWYAKTAGWSWDFGWTICNTTTIYYPGENEEQDQANWRLAPDGSLGTTRRLEAAWYDFRSPARGAFVATQFGEIVSGMDDPRCSGTTTKHGETYDNVCLEQYIAPTMQKVSYPDNAVQKTFDSTGVQVPN